MKNHLGEPRRAARRFELDGVAKAFKSVDQPALEPSAIAIVEVRATENLILVGSGRVNS
jgi:hypothetical protein